MRSLRQSTKVDSKPNELLSRTPLKIKEHIGCAMFDARKRLLPEFSKWKFGGQLLPTNMIARWSFRAIPGNRANGVVKAWYFAPPNQFNVTRIQITAAMIQMIQMCQILVLTHEWALEIRNWATAESCQFEISQMILNMIYQAMCKKQQHKRFIQNALSSSVPSQPHHYSDVTCALWRPKIPASRLLVQ